MEQLLVHLLGDFILQSDYEALNKSKRSLPCFLHVLTYTACFLILTTSWKALLVIGGTHFIIDRFPILVKKLIYLKNHLSPGFRYVKWEKCDATGYYDNLMNEVKNVPNEKWESFNGSPETNGFGARLNYVTLWLYIITDNFLHLTINYFALKYLV